MSFAPEQYQINNLIFEPYLAEEDVESAILKMAEQINKDYKNRQPIFIVTLKGAIFFSVKLLQNIKLDCSIEIISAKSYGSEMESSCNVKIHQYCMNLQDRDVIILEDIIDTGYTIDKLMKTLQECEPRTLAVASLVAKPEKFCIDININYLGFNIPSRFVIGSGMDYDEKGRNLAGIYMLKE